MPYPNQRITQIFYHCWCEVQKHNKILLIYQIARVLLSFVVLINKFTLWPLLLLFQSLFALSMHARNNILMSSQVEGFLIFNFYLKAVILQIAETLSETLYIRENDQESQLNIENLVASRYEPFAEFYEFQERTNLLIIQIKSQVFLIQFLNLQFKLVAQDSQTYYLTYFCFLSHQALFLVALYQLLNEEENPILTHILEGVFVLISLVQYFRFYSKTIFIVLSMPVVFYFGIAEILSTKRQKLNKIQIVEEISKNVVLYDNSMEFDEAECRICINPYKENEEILTLPCNKLHHFHKDCIQSWLVIETKCPICRASL